MCYYQSGTYTFWVSSDMVLCLVIFPDTVYSQLFFSTYGLNQSAV